MNEYGMIPLEACFIDDMNSILAYTIERKFEDPNLSVGDHNMTRLF